MTLLVVPAGARAASPASGSVGPSRPSVGWTGASYLRSVTPAQTECPVSPDPAGACDHFLLTVDVAPSHWETGTGGAAVAIRWADQEDNFDLYVYDASGTVVARSAQPRSTGERVLVPRASGTYDVRVSPTDVTDSGYDGEATFVSEAEPSPRRVDGGLAFAPATVVDAQRFMLEPLNHVDARGNHWMTGPVGVPTSFLHRSADGGDQFNIVSPVGQRPTPPPGGADSDITTDDQGYAYFSDLEATAKIEVSVSNDDGNTWRKNPAAEATTADDRQWLAVDDGRSPSAADNTVFLAYRQVPLGSFVYSSPGSTGPADPVGGVVFQDSSSDPATPVSGGYLPCGKLRFDPVRRNLYYPCSAGDHLEVTIGHVEPGQRTGIAYRRVALPASPGGGPVHRFYPGVGADAAGNVYAAWADGSDQNVYYAASTDGGGTWGRAVRVNGDEARSNVWPWLRGGADGIVALAWYGSDSPLASEAMPAWATDPKGATRFPWFGYAAVVTDATSAAPAIVQQRFTRKPMHYGQICNGGLSCANGGDRTMAEFLSLDLDRDGSLRIAYNDTTSQHHYGHPYEVRQLKGPGLLGGRIERPEPSSPMADPTGDARFPHYAPGGPGPNHPHLDLTAAAVSIPRPGVVRVTMSVAGMGALAPPAGTTSSFWLARFQARSSGDWDEEAYRIFFLGAESTRGEVPTFFAGSTTLGFDGKVVQYLPEVVAQGAVEGATITVDAALDGGFGTHPVQGDVLHNVTVLSGGRHGGTADVHADVDATRSFDFRLRAGGGAQAGGPAQPTVQPTARPPGAGLAPTGGSGGRAALGSVLLGAVLVSSRLHRRSGRPSRRERKGGEPCTTTHGSC